MRRFACDQRGPALVPAPERTHVPAATPRPEVVLDLQRGVGNAAVARLLGTAATRSSRALIMRVSAAEQSWSEPVGAKEWARAVEILDDLTNEEAERLVRAMSEKDRDELFATIEDLPRRDRVRIVNRLTFLIDKEAPPADTKTGLRDFAITDAGTSRHQGAAGTGQVELRSDVGIEGGGKTATGHFSLAYTGGRETANTRWLQFVSRELEVEYEGGTVKFARAPYVSPSGTWRFSDPQQPEPHVDSVSASSPFFEARGLNVRSPDTAAIVDGPSRPDSALSEFERRESEGNNRSIARAVTRAHFVSYVIQGTAVAYRVAFTIEWPWRPEPVGRTVRNIAGGPVNALDAGHRSVLARDYPWAAAAIGAPAPVPESVA